MKYNISGCNSEEINAKFYYDFLILFQRPFILLDILKAIQVRQARTKCFKLDLDRNVHITLYTFCLPDRGGSISQ